MNDRRRNILRCPRCGFSVYSESNSRQCAKCDKQMVLEGQE